jgi:periplasmic protein TonB
VQTSYAANSRPDSLRWAACFIAVLACHGLAALALLSSSAAPSDFDAGAPVVMLDLPEVAAAPMTARNDVEPAPPEPQTQPFPPVLEDHPMPPEAEAEIAVPEPIMPPKSETPKEEPLAQPSVAIPLSLSAPPAPGAEVQTPRRDVVRWQSMLVAHIERFKRYPAEARARGMQGTVQVAFTIDHEGHVLTSRIMRSSGYPALDQETLDVLARAQPMPRPPDRVPDRQLSFAIPVRFSIK